MFEIFHSISPVGFAIIAVISLGFVVTIGALVDLIKSDFKAPNDKLVWAIIILGFGLIGSILYFAYGTKQKIDIK
jgi:Phospholipase_D-nuclease N-terminal